MSDREAEVERRAYLRGYADCEDGDISKYPRKFVDDNFWAKVDKTNSCWLWTASIRSKGYGAYSFKGKIYRAHKYLWEKLFGRVPKNLQLDHLCRVRRCVNPEHLEIVTNRENILRGLSISAINARKTKCLRGHPLSGPNLRLIKGEQGFPARRCLECKRQASLKGRKKRTALGRLARGKHPSGADRMAEDI